MSLGEWERKRLSGLSRGERMRGGEVGHSEGRALRFGREAKKNQRENGRKFLREKVEKRKEIRWC